MDTPHLSDTGESETDDYEYVQGIWEDENLSAIKRTTTKQLSLRNGSFEEWKEPAGFREAYQNW